MTSLHEIATLTSKGQLTLPKSIRQILGIEAGGKVAFDLNGSQVVVTRADSEEHCDPAIASFLALLESDIRSARNVRALSDELAQSMLANLNQESGADEEIVGDVEL